MDPLMNLQVGEEDFLGGKEGRIGSLWFAPQIGKIDPENEFTEAHKLVYK